MKSVRNKSINDYGEKDNRKICLVCGWKTNLLIDGMCFDCKYPDNEVEAN